MIGTRESLVNIGSRQRRKEKPVGCATYLRTMWPDLVSIVFVAMLTGVIYLIPMSYDNNRVVPMSPSGFAPTAEFPHGLLQAPPELQHRFGDEPVPSWICGLVDVLLPFAVIGAFQLGAWSLREIHAGVTGVLKANVATTLFSVLLKHFVGGFRPYFIDACKPDTALIYREDARGKYWLSATACTGSRHDIDRALQSFPSGHTANSFAAAIFLALYLNAKLKVFADHASSFGAFIVTIAPLIGASLISGSMYTSHQHHASDILWGMAIGILVGTLAYRSSFAAILDFRYNHIPLSPVALDARSSCTPTSREVERTTTDNNQIVISSFLEAIKGGERAEETRKEATVVKKHQKCEDGWA